MKVRRRVSVTHPVPVCLENGLLRGANGAENDKNLLIFTITGGDVSMVSSSMGVFIR